MYLKIHNICIHIIRILIYLSFSGGVKHFLSSSFLTVFVTDEHIHTTIKSRHVLDMDSFVQAAYYHLCGRF